MATVQVRSARRAIAAQLPGPFAATAAPDLTPEDEAQRVQLLARVRALHRSGNLIPPHLALRLRDGAQWWARRLDDLRIEQRWMRESRAPSVRAQHYDAAMSAIDGARIWAREMEITLDQIEQLTIAGA